MLIILFFIFWPIGVNKGHLGGIGKVSKIRDRFQRIRRKILVLRKNEGRTFILAQS